MLGIAYGCLGSRKTRNQNFNPRGDKEIGGISRTVERNGWRFDIGGHRFFTKVDEVYQIWDEILDKRSSFEKYFFRIYYKKSLNSTTIH